MSVKVADRKPQKFGVLLSAETLAAYTVQICANETHFPKKYRWALTNKMVDLALSIAIHIREANAINAGNPEDYNERRGFQLKAKGECGALLELIQIALMTMPVGMQKAENWSGLVKSTLDEIDVWMNSDKKRYARA